MADHLGEQDACVTKAGNVAKAVEIDMACSRIHIPNDWSIFRVMYTKLFAAWLDPKHPESQTARRLGACVADLYIKEAEGLGCEPMDPSATTSEKFFTSPCVDSHQHEIDRKMSGFVQYCVASSKH